MSSYVASAIATCSTFRRPLYRLLDRGGRIIGSHGKIVSARVLMGLGFQIQLVDLLPNDLVGWDCYVLCAQRGIPFASSP